MLSLLIMFLLNIESNNFSIIGVFFVQTLESKELTVRFDRFTGTYEGNRS